MATSRVDTAAAAAGVVRRRRVVLGVVGGIALVGLVAAVAAAAGGNASAPVGFAVLLLPVAVVATLGRAVNMRPGPDGPSRVWVTADRFDPAGGDGVPVLYASARPATRFFQYTLQQRVNPMSSVTLVPLGSGSGPGAAAGSTAAWRLRMGWRASVAADLAGPHWLDAGDHGGCLVSSDGTVRWVGPLLAVTTGRSRGIVTIVQAARAAVLAAAATWSVGRSSRVLDVVAVLLAVRVVLKLVDLARLWGGGDPVPTPLPNQRMDPGLEPVAARTGEVVVTVADPPFPGGPVERVVLAVRGPDGASVAYRTRPAFLGRVVHLVARVAELGIDIAPDGSSLVATTPRGGYLVVARRHEPADDLFPAPSPRAATRRDDPSDGEVADPAP